MTTTRLAALGREEPPLLALAQRLLAVAESGLAPMLLPGGEAFAFTMAGRRAPDGSWALERRGISTRYAAITALGARFLPEDRQRAVLGGRTAQEFTGLLVESLPAVTNLGDAALIAWAAADTEHPKLTDALARVDALDEEGRPQYTVEAAWVLSALAAARSTADVERRFSAARDRLLRARIGDGPLFPHATGPGLVPWYRSHVSCFADQTYPLQALARAHAAAEGVAIRRRWPRPRRVRRASVSCRATAGSGGGTTTRAPAASWRATRSTASTSTRWRRRPCSI